MSELVFGINGGGSFSRMRVERGLEHIGTFHSAGINLCSNSRTRVEEHIAHLFEQARASLGLAFQDYHAGCIGSAGVEHGRDINTIRAVLRSIGVNAPVYVCSDAEILLRGCCGKADGSIVIAGTGSIALATWSNTVRRFGGYGHVLGDEGSAYWIAVRMFAKVLRDSEEGRRPSAMAEVLVRDMAEKTQGTYASVETIIPYVYSRETKAHLARHAAILTQALIERDDAAQSIADDAARRLHALVARVHAWSVHATQRIFVDGGVFDNAFIYERFTALCKNYHAHITRVGAEETAERGACMLARQTAIKHIQ